MNCNVVRLERGSTSLLPTPSSSQGNCIHVIPCSASAARPGLSMAELRPQIDIRYENLRLECTQGFPVCCWKNKNEARITSGLCFWIRGCLTRSFEVPGCVVSAEPKRPGHLLSWIPSSLDLIFPKVLERDGSPDTLDSVCSGLVAVC